MLVAFDNKVGHMLSNKILSSVASELFIRDRKLNISLVFITEYYFYVPKHLRLNSTRNFIMEILNKREPGQIEFNYS